MVQGYIDPSFAHLPPGASPASEMAEITGDFKTRITEGREKQKANLNQIGADILTVKTAIKEAKQEEFTPAQEKIIKRLQERRDELIQQKQELREGIRAFGHDAKKLAKELAADQKEVNRLSKKVEQLSQKPNFIRRIFVGGTTTRMYKAESTRIKARVITEKAETQSAKLDPTKSDYDRKIADLRKQATRFQNASEKRIALAGDIHKARQEVTARRQEIKEVISKYPKETREKLTEKLGQLKAQETALKTLEYRMGKEPIETDAKEVIDDEAGFMGHSSASLTEAQDHISTLKGEVDQLFSSPQKNPKTIGERITSLITSILPTPKPEKVDAAEFVGEINTLQRMMDSYADDVSKAWEGVSDQKVEEDLQKQLDEIKKLAQKMNKYDISDQMKGNIDRFNSMLNSVELLVKTDKTPFAELFHPMQNVSDYKCGQQLKVFYFHLSQVARLRGELGELQGAHSGHLTNKDPVKLQSLLNKQSAAIIEAESACQECFIQMKALDSNLSEETKKLLKMAQDEFDEIKGSTNPIETRIAFEERRLTPQQMYKVVDTAANRVFDGIDRFDLKNDTLDTTSLRNRFELLKQKDTENSKEYGDLLQILTEFDKAVQDASNSMKKGEQNGVIKGELKAKIEELGERLVRIKFKENKNNLFTEENPRTLGAFIKQKMNQGLNAFSRSVEGQLK